MLTLGVYDAVASFNYGGKPTVDLFSFLNLGPGYFTMKMCEQQNFTRKYVPAYKNMASSKKRRKIIRGAKKKSDKCVVVFNFLAFITCRWLQYFRHLYRFPPEIALFLYPEIPARLIF